MLRALCVGRRGIAPGARRLFSSTGLDINARTEARLRGAYSAFDPRAVELLARLQCSEAPLVWHKHGTFYEHLRDVWVMLCAWEQPQTWCRLGLFHSAYSNSFVSMGVFDRDRDRDALRALIGDEAENLVYKFCAIDRQSLEATVLTEGIVRPTGYPEMRDITTGDPLPLSGIEAAAMITETLADEIEQRFGWQSDLEAGRVLAPWPGAFVPTLRLSRTSRLARALRASSLVAEDALPPIFGRCSEVLEAADEESARDAYAIAIGGPARAPVLGDSAGAGARVTDASDAATLDALHTAQHLNPYVGEPHLVEAQLHLQEKRWVEAEASARTGVEKLEVLATSWDKRMHFQAWLNWGRCLGFQAQLREWPSTHGGIESLGAVVPRQRARGLNVGRSMA